MSKLVELDLDACQDHEPEGQKYGYCLFQQLTNASTIQKVPQKASTTVTEINASPADSALYSNMIHEDISPVTPVESFL